MLFSFARDVLILKLSEILRNYRSEHGLTLQAFADRANLTKQYLSMLENNKNSKNGKPIIPSIETLRKLANAMYMSADSLIAMIDDEQSVTISSQDAGYYTDPEVAAYADRLKNNPDMRLLFDAAEDMTKEDIDFVVDMIERLKAREGKE
mgnify:CR=1 FL=1